MHNGGNENISPASLCRNGCGFYGSSAFEGMCSKCFKDTVKKKQQNPAPPQVAGRTSPAGRLYHDFIVVLCCKINNINW